VPGNSQRRLGAVTQDLPDLKFLSRVSGLRRSASSADWDIRGYRVLDVEANEVGRVSDLLVEPETHRVRSLEIRTLGPEERTLIVPFHLVTVVGRDRVILPCRLEEIDQAPR